jgi:hypothetical protein
MPSWSDISHVPWGCYDSDEKMIKVGIVALHLVFISSVRVCAILHALLCGVPGSLHVVAAHFLLALLKITIVLSEYTLSRNALIDSDTFKLHIRVSTSECPVLFFMS